MCGTAVVVAPIGNIVYNGKEIIPQHADGPLGAKLRGKLEDIMVRPNSSLISTEELSTHSPTKSTNISHFLHLSIDIMAD